MEKSIEVFKFKEWKEQQIQFLFNEEYATRLRDRERFYLFDFVDWTFEGTLFSGNIVMFDPDMINVLIQREDGYTFLREINEIEK